MASKKFNLKIITLKKMSKTGTVVIIEDDIDDKNFLIKIFKKLNIKNDVKWCENTKEALEFLSTTTKSIFIIFSDINLPGRNGLELKHAIDEDPKMRKKSIPFVFYSTTAHQPDVNEAYTKMTIQGFFKKGNDSAEIENTVKTIMNYWSLCKHPNTQ